MPKTPFLNPTNVRLDAKAKERVERVARNHGIKTSDLIRDAIAAKLPIWESEGVRLTQVEGA